MDTLDSEYPLDSFTNHAADMFSADAFQHHRKAPILISTESLPESTSLINFSAFAEEYPEKIKPLLDRLRPEFVELFGEYYLLHKSQGFIGKVHGQIQTRIWQQLRIIEQAIGSMILLGPEPDASTLRPILEEAGLEQTPHGSLTDMILYYAASHSYAVVAKKFSTPIPMIRKIFRPAIQNLLAHKNIKAVAVGAYLRSLTHQASLTGEGLGKSCLARIRRVKTRSFTAPPSHNSPIMTFGAIINLRDIPWCMLEISSDHRMAQIYDDLHAQGKKVFGKHTAQIFAPVNKDGELAFGYIFARCTRQSAIRALTRVRGVSELAAILNEEGRFVKAVTIPNEDIRQMMAKYQTPELPDACVGDFVQILTGDAAHYCGTVTNINPATEIITVEISFPTGRKFIVKADASCIQLLPDRPKHLRKFWGTRLD